MTNKPKLELTWIGKGATAFTATHGGKPWKYLLIPHDEVSPTSSFDYFVSRFTQTQIERDVSRSNK